jgi:hypothetical protein
MGIHLIIALHSESIASSFVEEMREAYVVTRLSRSGVTEPLEKRFRVTVATGQKSILKRVKWFYLAIVDAYDLGPISRLLALIWAIFGAFSDKISITQPTNKYERVLFEHEINTHLSNFEKLGARNQFCIASLLKLATIYDIYSKVYENFAGVFKCMAIKDDSFSLTGFDFSKICIRVEDARDWKTVAALVGIIMFCGIEKMKCSAGKKLGENFDYVFPCHMSGSDDAYADFWPSLFEKGKFCIDTTGDVPPEAVFVGGYVNISTRTFGDTDKTVYGYAGKGKCGQEVIFYTTKKGETT